MIFTFKELTSPFTKEEAQTAIYDVLAVVGVTTTSWKPGAVVRTIITGFSILLVALSTLISLIAASGFLDLAKGLWLDLVAWFVYGERRIVATFAEGVLTLTNQGVGVYNDVEADSLVVSNGVKTYRNVSTFSLGAGQTITIEIRAVEAGAASSTPHSTITIFETPLGADVICTNALGLIAYDAELDPELRLRCRGKIGARSPNGPADAYAYFARAALLPDGSNAGVTGVRVVKGANGHVTTYVRSAGGAVEGAANDPATALGAAHLSIQKNAVPVCVTETTASATPKAVDHVYTLWVYDSVGLGVAELVASVQASVARFYATRPIGGDTIDGLGGAGYVYQSALRAAIRTREEIFRIDLPEPAGDTAIAAHEAPVLGALLPVAIHVVPAPTV